MQRRREHKRRNVLDHLPETVPEHSALGPVASDVFGCFRATISKGKVSSFQDAPGASNLL
jgi:hypothetical protein